MDAVSLYGVITGAALEILGIVLLWTRQRMGSHSVVAKSGIGIPAPRASPLPACTGELDVTRPARKTTSPERSAALPDWLHQSDAGSGKCIGLDNRSEHSATPRAVPRKVDAHLFMAWLNAGLKDGSIRVNEARAPVHFVEQGMLLVSPRIFREYANSHGDRLSASAVKSGAGDVDAARWIQRRVLRARWHLPGMDGTNFSSYRVMLGAQGERRLSGVLIFNPERFVSPVPPANPLLIPYVPEDELRS